MAPKVKNTQRKRKFTLSKRNETKKFKSKHEGEKLKYKSNKSHFKECGRMWRHIIHIRRKNGRGNKRSCGNSSRKDMLRSSC